MIKKLDNSSIILFGEFHNNSIAHWLQLELIKDRFLRNNLILGAEMFEADQQAYLDDYLNEKISDKELNELTKLWPNYQTDYRPLVDFAKENKLDFIATNIPRRYASEVYKKGGFQALDSLSESEKKWIAPLPVKFDLELSQYKNMLEMMGDHGSIDMVKAQAIKDATMGFFISSNMKENHQFIHFNGSYHSDFYQGIMWYLNTYNPTLKISTITIVEQENIYKLESENLMKADFIICVDTDVTKTY